MVPWAGRILTPLMSSGVTIFLRANNAPGSWMKAKQKCTSFISAAAYLRYHVSSAAVPLRASEKVKGISPAEMTGKRPG